MSASVAQDVVLSDGSTVRIRSARPEDAPAVPVGSYVRNRQLWLDLGRNLPAATGLAALRRAARVAALVGQPSRPHSEPLAARVAVTSLR